MGYVDPLDVDCHCHQLLRNPLISGFQRRVFADKVLFPVDEDVHAGFDCTKVGTIFHRPDTPSLLKTHRKQRARAIPAIAQIRAGLFDSVSQAHKVLWLTIDFVSQFAREANPVDNRRHAADKGLAQIAELEGFG